MAMTLTQKIIAAHCGKDAVAAGELLIAKVDRVLANDITAPVAIDEFNRLGRRAVFAREKVTLVMDHFAPNKDIKSAGLCKKCRDFARKFDLPHFYDGGEMGIEHVLLPEKGLVTGGDLVIGADSHTCTYGGIGAFATGVGSTDLGMAIATGEVWLKVPTAIKINLRGKRRRFVDGKDLILHLIGILGVDGALYQSLEFAGDGVADLSVSDRLCVCNMAIEAGGKNGIFPVDSAAEEFLRETGAAHPQIYAADRDAVYAREITVDLAQLEPTVAFPHLPSNTRVFKDIPEIKIDQVVIGSCTNGRLPDLASAAEILRGKKVAKGVRVIVIPGSPQVYLRAVEMGLVKIFIESGALVSTPTCGPCLGGHMGILAKGERAVSTTNRNFVGRMGDPESEVYLASPQVAAASAIAGKIAAPQ